ncbi:MAG: winged helix-turn-helix transcriptional regulator, partial [Hamadaea sp.]|nr:winged helix-turn-helix transcriptional regulator [Hamadaea sp.]
PPHRPPPVSLRGHGLVLCPSVFCWPGVTVGKRPVAAGSLRYPARGVAALWESPEPASDALVALVGRTRAMMLTELAQPATTTDLATRLAVTSGAISQHLGVLRAAGLVTTSRDGRVTLHLRTERAEALLA